ncbi:MAG: tyrosine-type recombinase/integrase [Alphaproteobacteria bacterium]|jgi:integrase|nr:tyrosine-type recombinase/integrase [Alphaproteobacteria bacterium]
MPIAKITKSFVDKQSFTDKGSVLYADQELPGFYLKVGMRSKTYFVQKDIRGRSIRRTIGRHGPFTPDEARRIAKDKLYLMAQGIDPAKLEEEEQQKLVTLQMVLNSYCNTRRNLRDSTKNLYRYQLEKYLSDWMGRMVVDITQEMIVARHSLIGKENGEDTANSVMRVLRAMFNHAHATYDICEVNPVTYLSKVKAWFPSRRRKTYIKPHQLPKWWQAVHALENDTMRDFLLFLLFTGLRRGEACALRWSDIDFNDKTYTITKTKNGDPLTLPLGEYMFALFKKRWKRYGNYEYVFPGPGEHGHLVEPKKGIYRVIQNSGVVFSCHDLRRTFITIAESLDMSQYAIKRLVNHRVTDVTGGYIIFDVERLRDPVQRIEDFIVEKVRNNV